MSLKFRSLLVVTYGRSGSTLLQGVLNAIPGCVIRGENHNFCHGLYLTWQALSRTERHCQEQGLQATQRVEDPWYGAHLLSADRFLGVARNFVEQQLMGDDLAERPACLGFKEIRYLDIELSKPVPQEDYAQRLQGYLRFLGKIMPQLGIIFLTRSHDQVSRSGWWKNQPPELIRHHLEAFERVTQGFQAEGIGTFRLDYGDLLANGPAMQSLFAFLGAKYVREDVAAVLGREHSFFLACVGDHEEEHESARCATFLAGRGGAGATRFRQRDSGQTSAQPRQRRPLFMEWRGGVRRDAPGCSAQPDPAGRPITGGRMGPCIAQGGGSLSGPAMGEDRALPVARLSSFAW